MEIIKSTAPIIAAFVAALLGSFFGALFKEQLTDKFFKRKRKRDLRVEFTKNVHIFFSSLKLYAGNTNTLDFNRKIIMISKADDDNDKLHSYHEALVKDAYIDYKSVTEISANLISLATESEYYFKKHVSMQLVKLVYQMEKECSSATIMSLDGFKGLNRKKGTTEFIKRETEINDNINELREKYLDLFSGIFEK